MTESFGTCPKQMRVWFHTCGSRAVVEWRWGCRLPASSTGETASKFWSPASERSSGRSYAPGSPYTRCALRPSSPEQHRGGDTKGGTGGHRRGQERKKCGLMVKGKLTQCCAYSLCLANICVNRKHAVCIDCSL